MSNGTTRPTRVIASMIRVPEEGSGGGAESGWGARRLAWPTICSFGLMVHPHPPLRREPAAGLGAAYMVYAGTCTIFLFVLFVRYV